MAIVKFEQDPTQPFGTGNHTDETGKTVYTTDVESAKRLNPTLADQVSAQATAAATAAVGAPPAPMAGAVASNPEATGSAATGQAPAPYAPYAPPTGGADLVAKTDFVSAPAPAGGVPAPTAAPAPGGGGGAKLVGKLGQLPIAQTSSSSQTVKGRDAGKVATEIKTLNAADDAYSSAVRDNAAAGDTRATNQAQGEQALAIGEHTQAYQQAQQERAKEEAIASELKMLRGEKDGVIDPDRFISGLSTGGKISMVLLAGLSGAFGNMQGQGQNTFLGGIQRRIDEDIKSQIDQINSGRLRRNNLIASLQAEGADAKQAKLAYEARVYGAAANWARAKLKEQGLEGAQAEQANLAIAQLDQAAAARNVNLKQATEDKHSSTFNVVREPAKPAGGANDLEAFTKKLAARKAYEESGATPEQLKIFDESLGIPTPGGKSAAQLAREKPTEAAFKKTEAMSSMQGLYDSLIGLPDRVYTQESASLPKRMAHGATDLLLGEGAGEQLDVTLSKEDLAESQRFTQARESYLSQLSVLNGQGAMANQEYAHAKQAAGAANSPAQLRKAIENTLRAHGAPLKEEIQAENR